jgi:hypothetical protein
MLQWLYTYVSSIRMLQVFHLDDVKVDLDGIYMHVANVCFKCFRCFIRILQVLYLDVAYVCNGFQVFSRCFACVSNICCKCFSYFGRMLQVFRLGVVKVDLGVAHVVM